MSTAILEGYGDLIIHDGNTDFTIVKPTPFATNSTKVKRWWRQNYNVVTYEACAIVELLDFYIVVSCAQDVQLRMTFDGTSAVTFDVGYDKPGDGNIERILVVPKTEFHNPVNYDDYYYDYSTRELRKNSYGNGAVFDIFLSAALDLNFAVNKSLVDSISGNDLVSFTRASSGTFVGADGLIKTTPVNLMTRSQQLDQWNIFFGASVTFNAIAAPDGTLTADLIDLTNQTHSQVTRGFSNAKYSTTYTVSFYGKSLTGTEIITVYRPGSVGGSTSFTLTTEWQRFTNTYSTTESSNYNTVVFLKRAGSTNQYYIWGVQVEEGSSATDYIPTKSLISGAPRFDHSNTTPVNLVTYSEQLDQWIAGNNTTVTANAATAPDGTYTADRLIFTQQNSTFVSSNSFIASGNTYTASVYVKAVTPGTNDQFTLSFGGQGANNATSRFTATGEWQRFTATMTPTLSGGPKPFIINNEGDGFRSDIYVWGVQVEESSAANNYIPTTNTGSAAAVTTVESLGLLIEEARTNILLHSENMSAWFVGSGSSVTANQAVAPDGTTTADRVQHGSVGSSYLQQNVTTPGVTYTISIYAKAVTPGTNDQFTFQLGLTSNIFTATDKWQRFTFTDTAFGTSIYLNNGNDNFATDVYFWGAQIEEGDFATSYIATDSSTATRAADLAQITGTNFSSFYNTTEGTFFGDLTGPGGFGFIAHNGSNALRHGFAVATGTLFTTVSGISNHLGVAPTLIKNGGKFAYGYKANDYGAFGDGVNLPGTSPTTVPTGLIELALGHRGSFLANAFLNGHIKRLSYFPTRQPNETLQSITS